MDLTDPLQGITFKEIRKSPANRKSNSLHIPVAIIGMGAVMPKSKDLDQLWDNLAGGVDMVSEIPASRWDWQAIYGNPVKEHGKTNIKWGGFIDGVDLFDSLFFGISPREAEHMDPQQRIFLQTVWKTMENAGYQAADLSGTKTGLFVGLASMDYLDLMRINNIEVQAQTASGLSHCILANRISYLLNLRGPSEAFDTACSSSLVAVHKAIQSIGNGECDLAFAGGVNLILTPGIHLSLSKAGMLSGTGRCRAFDQDADGYVRSEGVCSVLLKPLDKAEADGDHIYGVIQGTAINHGGHSMFLTAPSSAAQAEATVSAWRKSGLDPDTVTYLEAHGSGTRLGDPVEVEGILKAFRELYRDWGKELSEKPRCGLGTIKSNLGHPETVAGIAGLIKVVLAMNKGLIPANLHYSKLNPEIKLDKTPFYIVDQNKEWDRLRDSEEREIPRRAGVNSYGFGGVNAHAVVEEYIDVRPMGMEAVGKRHLIVLSAKTSDRLKAYALEMSNYFKKKQVTTSAIP